jgi:hypothetical protein
VNSTRSLHVFIYIKMEDSSDQQWSRALVVGAVFALYRVCSLYNWFATILGNIRFRPQQSPPETDVVPPTHPSKFTAGGLVRPRRSQVPDQQHHEPESDV